MEVNRRLAAIMAADVVGYSRLMGRDEVGTLVKMQALIGDVVRPLASEHRGRIVKTMGDGFLGEFSSVIHAFHCAVKLQMAAAERNVGVPDDEQIVLRIGINIGDIIFEKRDVFGEGVNIAARLEGMARPGGICVSGRAYEDLRKLDLPFEDLGELNLKNIAQPVRAWAISPPGQADQGKPAPATRHPAAAQRPPPSDKLAAPEASAGAAARPGWRLVAVLAGVGVVISAAAIAYVSRPRPRPSAPAYVAAEIDAMPCSWLRISDQSSEDGVTIVKVSGASATPPGQIAAALMAGAKARGAKLDRVMTREVAPLQRSQCAWIDRLKGHRYNGVPRYTLELSPRTNGVTQARLTLDPRRFGPGGALYGVEPSGRIERIVDARDLATAPGVTRNADGTSTLNLMIDHVGWNGLVLLESAQPAPDGVIEASAAGEAERQRFASLAEAGGWRFELAWFNVGP